jgi:hypothetical protein
MKKLMMLAAMVALVAAVAVPAIAQVHHNNGFNDFNNGFNNHGNGFNNHGFNNFNGNNGGGVSQDLGNESESGNVTPSFSVQSSGNNSNQCVTPLQFGNTGNLNNAQGFLQYASGSGNLEAEGPSFTFAPELTAPCTQQVQQSSAASSQY